MMIHIRTFMTRTDAELSRIFLAGHGICAEVRADDLAGLCSAFHMANGAHLWVEEEQAEDACALLQDVEQQEAEQKPDHPET
ncbi:MAG: hypothetical protein OXT67_05480 [Zetaproteobacteria bacterium]|nr:hypothetical protein [Zetaproteobacteria bacterium]